MAVLLKKTMFFFMYLYKDTLKSKSMMGNIKFPIF